MKNRIIALSGKIVLQGRGGRQRKGHQLEFEWERPAVHQIGNPVERRKAEGKRKLAGEAGKFAWVRTADEFFGGG